MLYTYSDIVQHLMDYEFNAGEGSLATRYCKRAAADGLRELCNIHSWSFYNCIGSFNTVASYNTGTIEYDHTGGTYERMMTITDGTWPEWAMFGSIIIDNCVYDIAERKSDTVITLASSNNPGDDIASGSSFVLYRDAYPAPVDLMKVDRAIRTPVRITLEYITPKDWLDYRNSIIYPNMVTAYTLIGDMNYEGQMGFRVSAPPAVAEKIDFLYRRRPRPLKIHSESTGTVTATAGSDQITGTSTSFRASMVGSVIRFYQGQVPTGEDGEYPATYERVIRDVSSTSVLYLDDTIPEAMSGWKYCISDAVDIDKQVMLNAYKRTCELMLEQQRQGDNLPGVQSLWQRTMNSAISADKRFAGGGVATGGIESFSNGTNARPFGVIRTTDT